MSTSNVKSLAAFRPAPLPGERVARPALGTLLSRHFGVSPAVIAAALERQKTTREMPLGQLLLAEDAIDAETLSTALAMQTGAGRVRSGEWIAATEAIAALGLGTCIARRLLPLTAAGAVVPVATSRPDAFEAMRPWLTERLGPVAMMIVDDETLDASLRSCRRRELIVAAESRVEESQSCRPMGASGSRTALAVVAGLGAVCLAAPGAMFDIAACLALAALLANTALVITALLFTYHRARDPAAEASSPILARLPDFSVLVPLYRERDVAGALIGRLQALDYPRELVDLCLVVEEDDHVTRAALRGARLPGFMRVIAVPKGGVRTKPRAMNYALPFCRGEIVAIYDAEDAPAADQLHRAARRFAELPADVACLQGRLNFYNAADTWLTRAFAVDYATWFGLMLPALRRLGWPIPLGGTTLFVRRAVLEEVGAWDAHNVTEDADLGLRLARRGWRTELLDSTTLEEATPTAGQWIRQRSRWLKGYAVTYAVHMRDPARLWRELGPSGFLGVQVLFLGVLAGVTLAPILWSMLLLPFGLPHPWQGALPTALGWVMTTGLTGSLVLNAAANFIAIRRGRADAGARHVALMLLYHPMATAAIAKAWWELLTRPFYWDKTMHGATGRLQAPPASCRNRVS